MIQLGMFAKYWQPGSVKTRLGQTYGDIRAAELYYQFVVCLLKRFANQTDRQLVCCSPWSRRDDFAALAGDHWQLAPQVEGDLGTRMRHYFQSSRAGATQPRSVLLIGSDTPQLPTEHIAQAAALLEQSPVVLGPCDDGGYYLIGIRSDAIDDRLLATLFDSMRWSEPDLLSITRERLANVEIPFRELPTCFDVDDAVTLQRLHDELTAAEELDEPLWELKRVVGETIGG